MVRERLELGDESGENDADAERARGDVCTRDHVAAVREYQPDRERRRKPDRLRRGMHLATVPSAPRV